MNIKTVFELESIKDQLALINSLISHINPESFEKEDLDPDYSRLLTKLNNNARNLKEKLDKIKGILDN